MKTKHLFKFLNEKKKKKNTFPKDSSSLDCFYHSSIRFSICLNVAMLKFLIG